METLIELSDWDNDVGHFKELEKYGNIILKK